MLRFGHPLERLERSMNDHVKLLEEFGPEYFSIEELWKMYGQWELKAKWFQMAEQTWLRMVMFFCAATSLFIVGIVLQVKLILVATGILAIGSLSAGIVAYLIANYLGGSKDRLRQIGRMIRICIEKKQAV
ncbi:MAG: hypothetical protein KDC57_08835 [Saprospiraceae bacterium]|nr:hypothetical protein [Saprospiraceae bacterium]